MCPRGVVCELQCRGGRERLLVDTTAAAAIRRLRLEGGYSSRRFARALGVSARTIRGLDNASVHRGNLGKRVPAAASADGDPYWRLVTAFLGGRSSRHVEVLDVRQRVLVGHAVAAAFGA
jgi:predicted transcriptional regulator